MSLADELLADFESIDDIQRNVDENENENENLMEIEEKKATNSKENSSEKSRKMFSSNRIDQIAKLRNSSLFIETMEKIDYYRTHQRISQLEIEGVVEHDPEYLLIVDANKILVEIDNEIDLIHNFVKTIYRQRFSELEQLIQIPLDYLRTVQELANNVEKAKTNENLSSYLPPATIMIVSVSASTTQGTNLSDEDLDRVLEACQLGKQLSEHKEKILNYVESRMTFIAPNLSIIVGASTAAKLLGLAGGLTNLSKMPSCNILLLGSHRKNLSGFSTTAARPHAGFIYYSKLVQDSPPDLRVRIARSVSCKVALAARVDSFHQSPNGEKGKDFLAEIEKRLEKLDEPAAVKSIKPLPPPIEPSKKKRGGRRERKRKERLGMSELSKQRNRTIFGQIGDDAYQEDLGFSLGAIGKSGSGKIRVAQVDSKTKAKISRTLQKDLQKQNNQIGGSTTVQHRKQISGTASSVAFTPSQGLEIVNPHAQDKDKTGIESQKYFSTSFGFTKISPSVIPKST